ncbi:MAG: hypothetical protein MJE77_00380 [Proteobacteria bacterium]|nr:hypothetical protein [Pseudomonadota bacterium]
MPADPASNNQQEEHRSDPGRLPLADTPTAPADRIPATHTATLAESPAFHGDESVPGDAERLPSSIRLGRYIVLDELGSGA